MQTRYALRAYESVGLETGVAGASPPQLVVMLHEGAVAAIRAARQHLDNGDIAAKGRAISKAISIIDGGLRASLDPTVGGPLAGNLLELYRYMSSQLLEANINDNGATMDQVIQLLQQLKSAWQQLAGQQTPTDPWPPGFDAPKAEPVPILAAMGKAGRDTGVAAYRVRT